MDYTIADGGVRAVHWRCEAEETVGEVTHKASRYGTVPLKPNPNAPNFIPFPRLKEQVVRQWVWNAVDKAETEAAVLAKLEVEKAPTIASGLPW
ncbi:MAG: hypothetical protein EBT13_03610 [Rhodobacteraceae bacterium]|nr:hypothetical protein [Paracoccaceae bacterium]